MKTFRDFLQWHNNNDIVPTLDVMQKIIEFYHDKGIDMLKLVCTLPNLANFVYTSQPFISFTHSFRVIVTCLKKYGKI